MDPTKQNASPLSWLTPRLTACIWFELCPHSNRLSANPFYPQNVIRILKNNSRLYKIVRAQVRDAPCFNGRGVVRALY